ELGGASARRRSLLPLHPAAGAQRPDPAAPRGAGGGAVSQRAPLRVLVVEDDPAVRLSVRLLCQREGLVVAEAGDGPRALALGDEAPPDRVLLDLRLPGLSGLDVCRVLRRRAETARLPVIILTARGDEADKVAGLELGADDYVTKPFSPRELVARM